MPKFQLHVQLINLVMNVSSLQLDVEIKSVVIIHILLIHYVIMLIKLVLLMVLNVLLNNYVHKKHKVDVFMELMDLVYGLTIHVIYIHHVHHCNSQLMRIVLHLIVNVQLMEQIVFHQINVRTCNQKVVIQAQMVHVCSHLIHWMVQRNVNYMQLVQQLYTIHMNNVKMLMLNVQQMKLHVQIYQIVLNIENNQIVKQIKIRNNVIMMKQQNHAQIYNVLI